MSIDTNIALTSLSDAKAFLGITGSSEDTIVGDLVNMASDVVNKYCNRKFLAADYTEYYNGDGTFELILKNYPVNSVDSLYDDVLRAFDSTSEIDVSADVLVDGSTGILRLWNNESAFEPGQANVKVTYNAGYALASMPYSVKQAVHLIMQDWYKNAYQFKRTGIASETNASGESKTFQDNALPEKVTKMLDPYIKRDDQPGSPYS